MTMLEAIRDEVKRASPSGSSRRRGSWTKHYSTQKFALGLQGELFQAFTIESELRQDICVTLR